MNKLVYVLALGVTGIALTVATTVSTDTSATFAGASANETITVAGTEVNLTNSVLTGTQSEAQIEIQDASGDTLGTFDTTTTVAEEKTEVTGDASVDVTANLTDQTPVA